jgi:hypothetical protein
LPRDGGALLEWSATMILRTAAAIALVLFTPLAAEAQHAGKVYRIGILGRKAQTRRKLVSGRPSGWACGSTAGSKAKTS